MKMSMIAAALAAALVSAGCAARGFNRKALRQDLEPGAPKATDAAIAEVLARRPQLPKPFKLAVYLREPDGGTDRDTRWRWTPGERESVYASLRGLRRSGEASEIFPLVVMSGPDTEVLSLRMAAAQQGADALLVVSGAVDLDSYSNDWAATYGAIVTMFFVPGSKLDVLFLSRAALWDVRNQFLYFAAETESVARQTRPLAQINQHQAVETARGESLQQLTAEIEQRLQSLQSLQISQTAR